MFRIRRIYDAVLPVNQAALREIRAIFEQQFPDAPARDIEHLGERLRNPFKKQFRTLLSVAENSQHRTLGFSIVLHEPTLHFCYLDFLASDKEVPGRGIGAALYEHVRDEAFAIGSKGLFFECLPDDPDRCQNPKLRKLNAARLKFYEQYGARPILNTLYEAPVRPDETDNLPHLVWDGLDQAKPLSATFAKQVVQAVLERKYSHLCSPEYVQCVVDSFRDDPVKIRDFRYLGGTREHKSVSDRPLETIALAINDRHDIHHIRERGYVESPVRIKAILSELEPTEMFEAVSVKDYPMKHILDVHDSELVGYLEKACANAPDKKSIYPYVFPIRNATRPPKELSVLAGYYCIDTFTPIHRNAFPAAKRAADCAMTAAEEILDGRRIAYALVRPPGHHAEKRSFGGFCYFCNAAVAAHHLSRFGRVAILDIDYHHGNGQQDIFYNRSDVFTISMHGDPDFAYPYFTGFAEERGSGEGEGFNLNMPLPETLNGTQYFQALQNATAEIRKFDPEFLVIALGLDPAKGDPTGTWTLQAKDFEANGRHLGELQLPTLVVQEGGYLTRTLGKNAKAFFSGLTKGMYSQARSSASS